MSGINCRLPRPSCKEAKTPTQTQTPTSPTGSLFKRREAKRLASIYRQHHRGRNERWSPHTWHLWTLHPVLCNYYDSITLLHWAMRQFNPIRLYLYSICYNQNCLSELCLNEPQFVYSLESQSTVWKSEIIRDFNKSLLWWSKTWLDHLKTDCFSVGGPVTWVTTTFSRTLEIKGSLDKGLELADAPGSLMVWLL